MLAISEDRGLKMEPNEINPMLYGVSGKLQSWLCLPSGTSKTQTNVTHGVAE